MTPNQHKFLAECARRAREPVAWIERRFANGELVLETVKLQKMPDDLRANLALHYDLEIVPLYVAPPEVAELQKQVQALQADNEKLRDKANHAEKWQGIALAKHGDGRTVQQLREDIIAELKDKS